jgi:hypothetical protein
MERPIHFEEAAKEEFADAIGWYDNERPGLGKEFAGAVYQTLDLAHGQPEIFRKVLGQARKIRLK